MNNLKKESPLIIFDGICNICNKWVDILIRQDKKKIFYFASLQSDFGKEILQRFPANADSAILIHTGKIFTNSDVIVEAARILGGKWLMVHFLLKLTPRIIRNGVYTLIARNRYKWFGKRKECLVPDERFMERFID